MIKPEKMSVADRMGTNPDRVHTDEGYSLPRRWRPSAAVSIKDLIHKYSSTSKKTSLYDLTQTVDASEVGACMRKTWFSKHSEPHDVEYIDDWGARYRGMVMEYAFIVKALMDGLQDTAYRMICAGYEKRTLRSGYLSGTPNGLLVSRLDGKSAVNIVFKTIDSRADISKEKSSHHFQVQAQMGLWLDCTEHRPEYSIITYVNAILWKVIDEFNVEYDPLIYRQALDRAKRVMLAKTADVLPPEGKQVGGRECEHCPWASRCQAIVMAGVPWDT